MSIRTITFDHSVWQVVPKVSTSEMDIAGVVAVEEGLDCGYINRSGAERAWNAMLAAAPEPPAHPDETKLNAMVEKAWAMTDEQAATLLGSMGFRGTGADDLAIIRAAERYYGIGKGENDEG